MKTLDIQYRQAQSVNIDLGMLDIATFSVLYARTRVPLQRFLRSAESGRDRRDRHERRHVRSGPRDGAEGQPHRATGHYDRYESSS